MSEKPHLLKIDKAHVVNRDIDHQFKICSRDEKTEFIAGFLKKQQGHRGVIFCRTKAGAIVLGKQLTTKGFPVDVLQGDLTQKERDTVMRSFKKERTQFLIATDVAARGIDVRGVSHVINYDIPDTVDAYTHRIGRTGRACETGDAFTFVCQEDQGLLRAITHLLGDRENYRVMERFGGADRPHAGATARDRAAAPSRHPYRSFSAKPRGWAAPRKAPTTRLRVV
jgi:ATP-dependent RNA helicase DeaD